MITIYAQQDQTKDKEKKVENEKKTQPANDKENMGQSVKEVNAWYEKRKKEIKNDPSLSEEQKKDMMNQIKEQKNDRIHEINGGKAAGDNTSTKTENEKEKDKKEKSKKDKDPKQTKEPKEKGKKQ
jgi:hypothetical protein